jgi:ribosomal protein S18 acetylase RimI-like enzyme
MGDLVVRPAIRSDYSSIRDLLHDSDAWHAERLPSIFKIPAAPRFTIEELTQIISNVRCCLLIAESEGVVVGFVEASQIDAERADELGPPWCEIHNLYVRPRERRHGVGQRLVREVEQWARARELVDVRLTVYDFNKEAQSFYAQLGFEALSHQLISRRSGSSD